MRHLRIDFAVSKSPPSWTVFTAIVLWLTLTYMPAIQGYYLYKDDFNAWSIVETGKCESLYVYQFVKDMGRPFLNHVICSLMWPIERLSDANYVRFFGILILSGLSFIIYKCLLLSRAKWLHSLLFSLTVATLPPFNLGVGLLLNQPVIFAALIAAFAYLLALQGATLLTQRPASIFNTFSFAAVALMIVSMLIYQSSAMFYWFLLTVTIYSVRTTEWKLWQRKIIFLFAIGFISMGIYFVYAKANFSLNSKTILDTGGYAIVVTTDILSKFNFLKDTLIPRAIKFWSFKTDVNLNYTYGILSLGFLIGLAQTWRSETTTVLNKEVYWNFIKKGVLIAILLPLCVLPILAAGNTMFSAFRVYAAIMPFIALMLYWAWIKIVSLAPHKFRFPVLSITLICTLLFGSFQAHYNVGVLLNLAANLELRYISSILYRNDLKKFDNIHVILLSTSGPQSMIIDKSKGVQDEFGGFHAWNSHNFYTMVKTLLPDMPTEMRNRVGYLINKSKFTFGDKKDFKGVDENTLLIDMTTLYHFY